MMTTDEMIAVLQAHKEGKKIEVYHGSPLMWEACAEQPPWNFGMYDYRVAPREWWVYIDNDEIRSCLTKEFSPAIPVSAIRVREVLENE